MVSMDSTPEFGAEHRLVLDFEKHWWTHQGIKGAQIEARLGITSTDYKCPDWYERTDHHADIVGADNPPMRYGPSSGLFWMQAQGDGPMQVASHDLSGHQPIWSAKRGSPGRRGAPLG